MLLLELSFEAGVVGETVALRSVIEFVLVTGLLGSRGNDAASSGLLLGAFEGKFVVTGTIG